MSEGWVKYHRRLFDWQWFTEPNMAHFFMALVALANHKPGKWRGIEIGRGQLITGRKVLAEKTGLTERSVRTCLKKLISTSEVTIKVTNRFSIITICNYDKYQSCEDSERPAERPATGPTDDQQTTSQRPQTRMKELKNDKKKEERGPRSPFPSPSSPVLLSTEEIEKLRTQLGEDKFQYLVGQLMKWAEDNPSKFKQKKSHYRTILNWDDRERQKKKTFEIHPKFGPGYFYEDKSYGSH